MPRGRRKARCIGKTDRQGSQDSSDGCPKYKETKLSENRSNIHKFFTREVDARTSLPTPPLLDFTRQTPAVTAHAMDTANAEGSRDLACDSPTMPLLTPEVPNGDLSSCLDNGMPPKLRHYTEDDDDVDPEGEVDTSSEKSEGDSGKENEECVSGVKWRGSRGSSRGSRGSLTSRGSRPRSGPFNQLNPINPVVANKPANIQVKESEKKTVLCETIVQQQQQQTSAVGTRTTTTRTTRLQSRKQMTSQEDKKQQILISDKQQQLSMTTITSSTTVQQQNQQQPADQDVAAADSGSQAAVAVLGQSCTEQLTTRSSQLSLRSSTPEPPLEDCRLSAPPPPPLGVSASPPPLVLNTKEASKQFAAQSQESPHPMSPVKTSGPLTPQSPMSPHKIQMMPMKDKLEKQATLTDKLKQAISTKTFSTKPAQKPSTQHRANGTVKPTKKADKLAQAAEGSRSITDFFPIRRSERKKKSEIEKDWMEGIEARLLGTDDTDLDLEVMEIPCKGRGVVARKTYNKGDFVVEYAGELIDTGLAKDRETMYSLDVTKGCYMYYFNHRDKQYCIDATSESGRYGRLINHSCKTPNCVTKVVMLGDEPRLILVAKQVIEEGTELLYDYGDRSKESLKAHPWLAL